MTRLGTPATRRDPPAAQVDADTHGRMVRLGRRRPAQARRQVELQETPAPANIHESLLPHVRRWQRADLRVGLTSVVHFKCKPVRKLRRSWNTVAKLAGATRPDA